ncbi:hypothetical protein PFISCL1PPCAC_15131, partial [Pristionchus fissidentatus]
ANLASIDKIIGFSRYKGIDSILTVLKQLDSDGISVKDGYGTAPVPSFSTDVAIPLIGVSHRKTTDDIPLVLFYTSECVFSNYHSAPIHVDGNDFATSEQYFMWTKAKIFDDIETADEIINAQSPGEARKLGRKVRNFNEKVWNETSNRMMVVACYRKFQQNAALRKSLLATAGSVLVEASPSDRIWGIGLGVNHADGSNPEKWRGSNKLGRILTVIREHMIDSKLYQTDV